MIWTIYFRIVTKTIISDYFDLELIIGIIIH